MKVTSYKPKGNSFPIVIEHGDQKYLVKLRAGLSGEYSLLSEWLGNKIGRLIGLNTLQPQWISLSDSIKCDNIYIEVKDLIKKSVGINIGFDYIEEVKSVNLEALSRIDKENLIDVYLLDVLMLNIDRTRHNLNLLATKNDEILITDFESSLIFNELINGTHLSNNIGILQCLKSNPLYQTVNNNQLEAFLDKISKIDFDKLLSEFPSELLSREQKETVKRNIHNKKSNNWGLKELLQKLMNICLETDTERNSRIKENRIAIEQKINATQNNDVV